MTEIPTLFEVGTKGWKPSPTLRHWRKAETFNKCITWCLIVVFVVGQLSIVPTAKASRPGSSTISAGSAPPPAETTVESFQPDLFTGRAGTSLTIAVPPGRKNMQPQVGAGYSSTSQNGWLGVGWALDLGYIECSTKYGVPKYDGTDVLTFQLGGGNSELVKLADGTYRAEDEGVFLKFENLGTNGWRVTDKSGTQYLLGRTSSSRVENGPQVFRWCLDQVIDVNGNTINYSYASYGGQPHPSQIDYTGHTNGLAPACRVAFEWGDRPDIERNMRRGWEVTTPKRLVNIRTYATVGGTLTLANRYAFSYALSGRTGRSLLHTFTKFGSDDTSSLPPSTFTYQDADQPTYSITHIDGTAGQVAWNVQVAGLSCQHDNYGFISPYGPSICGSIPYGPTVVCTPGTRNVGNLNITVGSDGSIQIPAGQDYYVHAWTAVYCNSAKAVDFSRWGSWDVSAMWVENSGGMSGPYSANISAIPFAAGWNIIHLTGYNENQGYSMGLNNAIATTFNLMSPSVAMEPQLAGDVNGDGLNDLIQFDGASGTWKVSLSQGANFAPQTTWLTGFGTASDSPILGDWNADGRTDIGIFNNGTWRFATSTGTYFQPDTVAGLTFGSGSPLTGDFNGDGILDLGTYLDGQWKIAIGTGSLFAYNPSFDVSVSTGGALPANDVRWRVRAASYDCGHDNYGCMAPGQAPPCGAPNYVTALVGGGANVNGASVSVGGNGSLYVNCGQDRHVWSSICVYLKNPGTKSFSPVGNWDVTCYMWIEDSSGMRAISYSNLGSVSFAAGWSTIHLVGYNQNQGNDYGFTSSLTGQFDVVSPDIIAIPTHNVTHTTGDFNGDGLTDLAVVDDAFQANCRSCREIQEKGLSNGDGTYTIDPDGPGGNAPITVNCQMSLAGGGWTRLAQNVANTVLNQNSSSAREYLYVYGSAWYKSPVNSLVWDWNSGQDAYGVWGSSNGSFTINPSGEKTLYGVSASSGGGASPKCLIYYNNSKDPNNALVQICQDVPHAFPNTCQDGVTVYMRETVVPPAPVQSNAVSVAFSTGHGFVMQAAWPIDFNAATYSTADFNGDGISDLGFYDKTSGHIVVARGTGTGFAPSTALPVTFSQTTSADQMQVGEFNGDGLPDPAIFNPVSGSSDLSYSAGTAPDLLKLVDNGMGGRTTLTYQPSTKMNNTKLPFVAEVVTSVTMNDGLGHDYVKTYAYSGGMYDAPTKEFRGFGHVEVRDADQTASVTDFLQDYQRKGRAFRSAVYDVAGNLWVKEEKTYSSSTPYPGLNAYFTHLDQADAYVYDGDTTYTQTRVRHTYDAYGNLTASYMDGDVNVVGDEKSTVITFNLNPSAWILNTASLIQSFDAASNLVSQTRTYYDGASDTVTPPTKGNITRSEGWLNLPASQWIGTQMNYDPYGNASVLTDELGRSTTNTFDSTGTFIVAGQSPLGHKRTTTYDPRNGLTLSVTDQNNVTGYSYYDALGRKTGEAIVDPATGTVNVQAEMEYRVSSVPCRIKTTIYSQPGKGGPIVGYTFMDGWGRKLQVREASEVAGTQNVTGASEFDSKGRMVRQWMAYTDAFSEEYMPVPAANLTAPEEYTYDPVGRLLTTKVSAGTVSSVSYNDDVTTYTDARGNVQRRIVDGYGHIARVEENNGTNTYVTLYTYDVNGNITRIRDHLGNVMSATYDSLGRKIAMDDPDLGHWTYEYNAKNMVTKQTDARGSMILFTYDAMDRLVRKDYVVPAGVAPMASAVFTYDEATVPFSVGKLTRMTDASGTTTFAYDYMNNVVKESRTLDGTTYNQLSAFDFLGRLVNFTYPNGHVVTYGYDTAGGVETVSLKAGATTYPMITNIAYNAAGKVTRIAYGNGMVSDYSYHPLTLKMDHKHTVTSGGTVLQDLAYTRDAVGNIASITDTVNTGTQTFQYDALNRLIQATGASYGTQAFQYDAIGNMVSKAGVTMTHGSGVRPHAVLSTSSGLSLSYDANGNMTGRVSATTGLLGMKFDAENRLAEVQSTALAPSNVTLAAGMNLVGFPALGATAPVTNALNQFATSYAQVSRLRAADQKFESNVGNATYNQFTTLTPGEGYWVYCTNSAGATMNLPVVAGTPAARSLTNGWQILSGPPRAQSIAQWLSPLVAGLDYGSVKEYDTASAALVTASQAVPGKAYCVQILRPCVWTPAVAGQTQTIGYVYDADGGRMKKTTSAGNTLYIGRGYEMQGTNFVEYVMNGADRVASLDSAGALRYYLTDHLNSANLVVDSNGQVVELAEYAPYGQLSRHSGTMDTPFKFTGQRLDAESGLYLMNARYYDPELGHFTSPDTVTQDAFDPQTLNRYGYARDNPILFTDPSGNFFIIDDIIMAVVSFVIANAGAIAMGALAGSALSAGMAAIMGGDVGQAALLGAVSGAVTAGFGAWGASVMKGVEGGMYYLGKAAFDGVGAAAAGAAGAAIKGEPIGKAALEGFKMSIMMSAGNYLVGQWSGWSKDKIEQQGLDGSASSPYHDGMTVGGSGILTDTTVGKGETISKAAAAKAAGPMIRNGIKPPGYGKPFDVFFSGPSHGGVADVVECAQDIFFGPSSQSRSLATALGGMSGFQVQIICHSQGTINFTRALQMGGNSGLRFGANSSITFNNPPIDAISARAAAFACGIGSVSYYPDWRDLVSAIGSPYLLPSGLAFTGNLSTYHTALGFGGSGR